MATSVTNPYAGMTAAQLQQMYQTLYGGGQATNPFTQNGGPGPGYLSVGNEEFQEAANAGNWDQAAKVANSSGSQIMGSYLPGEQAFLQGEMNAPPGAGGWGAGSNTDPKTGIPFNQENTAQNNYWQGVDANVKSVDAANPNWQAIYGAPKPTTPTTPTGATPTSASSAPQIGGGTYSPQSSSMLTRPSTNPGSPYYIGGNPAPQTAGSGGSVSSPVPTFSPNFSGNQSGFGTNANGVPAIGDPSYGPGAYGPNSNGGKAPGDPGYQSTQEYLQAGQYGSMFQKQFGGAAAGYQQMSNNYLDNANAAYAQLMKNPGFTPEQATQILQQQGLIDAQTTPAQLQSNFLTSQQQQDIRGNPSARAGNLQANLKTNADIANQGGINQEGQFAKGATAIGGALTTGAQNTGGYIDPSKLTYGDDFVAKERAVAGESIGAQYGTQRDTLTKAGVTSGQANPAQMAAIYADMNRQQGIQTANAETSADVQAQQTALAARQNYANMGVANAQFQEQANVAAGEQQQATGIGMEQQIAAAKQQANQFGTQMDLSSAQDIEGQTQQRNQLVDLNSQDQNRQNQWQQWAQGYAANNALSNRYYSIGQQAHADEQEGRGYLAGEGQWAGGTAANYGQLQIGGANSALGGEENATKTHVGWSSPGGGGNANINYQIPVGRGSIGGVY